MTHFVDYYQMGLRSFDWCESLKTCLIFISQIVKCYLASPVFARLDISMLTDAALAFAVSFHPLAWQRYEIRNLSYLITFSSCTSIDLTLH